MFPTLSKQLVTWLLMHLNVWITNSFDPCWLSQQYDEPLAGRLGFVVIKIVTPHHYQLWCCLSTCDTAFPWSTVGRSTAWSLTPYTGDAYLGGLFPRLLYTLLWCRTSLSIAWHFVFGMFWFRISVLRLTGCTFKLWYSEFWHTNVSRNVLSTSSGSKWVAGVM